MIVIFSLSFGVIYIIAIDRLKVGIKKNAQRIKCGSMFTIRKSYHLKFHKLREKPSHWSALKDYMHIKWYCVENQ